MYSTQRRDTPVLTPTTHSLQTSFHKRLLEETIPLEMNNQSVVEIVIHIGTSCNRLHAEQRSAVASPRLETSRLQTRNVYMRTTHNRHASRDRSLAKSRRVGVEESLPPLNMPSAVTSSEASSGRSEWRSEGQTATRTRTAHLAERYAPQGRMLRTHRLRCWPERESLHTRPVSERPHEAAAAKAKRRQPLTLQHKLLRAIETASRVATQTAIANPQLGQRVTPRNRQLHEVGNAPHAIFSDFSFGQPLTSI